MTSRSLSLLCDLRPAFDGYYGIPHETRQMFRLLHDFQDVQVTGLINHPSRILARTFPSRSAKRGRKVGEDIGLYSRLAASICPPHGLIGHLHDRTNEVARLAWLHVQAKLGWPISLDHFDGTEFGDFVWQSLFAVSLAPEDFELCRTASYASLWAPWRALHSTSLVPLPRRYAKVDTRGYDVFVAQTPWPGVVAPQTQLVIRYHDAMPIFLPHTVKHSRVHQRLHSSALKANSKSGIFACVSEFSRTKLLRTCPELESRTMVVFDRIADDYFPEAPSREAAINIIASRIDPGTEPNNGDAVARQKFYDGHLRKDGFRYILMVSTLEPRKNHQRLLTAWESLRLKHNQPLAIVFVSSSGWNEQEIVRAMKKWQAAGSLFHLSSVSPAEMRALYCSADIVVCPSVSEGFDIPSVEAIRCGAAVAASNIPVHREILDDAVQYFDPYSTDSMRDALSRILTDPELPKALRCKAAVRAQKFDKSVVAEQWQSVFEYCRRRNSAAHADRSH